MVEKGDEQVNQQNEVQEDYEINLDDELLGN